MAGTKSSEARPQRLSSKRIALALLAAAPAVVSAQDRCISLSGSKACPAFASASISTSKALVDMFSFLQFVSDQTSFDNELNNFIKTEYPRQKFQATFHCQGLDLKSTSDLYARFTTTVICNAIVQNSILPCGLSKEKSRPMCAESCAEFAQSESFITSDNNLCSSPTQDLTKLIRADFANCHLPDDSLNSEICVPGIDNESNNCGYGNSTLGLCTYCGAGGLNSTDTCCYNSNAETICKDVKLPSLTATMSFTPPTATADPSSSSSAGSSNGNQKDDQKDEGGLSGGAIAGIVIGSLAGIALIAIAAFFCIRRRNQRPSSKGSIFNQPSPARKGPSTMVQAVPPHAPQGYEVLPGGRIARMSALEGHSGDSPSHHRDDSSNGGPLSTAGGYGGSRGRRGLENSSSDEYGESPASDLRAGVLRPPPMNPRRQGSLSSGSVLGSSVPQSPTSAGGFSSPQGMASQQSEQLPFFKDYYSQEDIHPGERVAVLWAYQPRANDEFSLERGDMLKVVGIWDDGWATGVLIDERAEEWEARRQAQRDSGVSNTSGRHDSPPAAEGEIKAFPLVCVCLPEHWRKTIEGDASTESGSNAFNNVR